MNTRMDPALAMRERAQMIDEQLRARGVVDERVLAAMAQVPREAFVPSERTDEAYADGALPLSHGQSISQPYMVARELELARLKPGDVVLDVGLGSGYQAAVAAALGARVVAVELIPELCERAATTLREAGYAQIEVHRADGTQGYAPSAPYDAILVAAATDRIPPALTEQLRIGGRLVIPLGDPGLQRLTVIERTPQGLLKTEHDECVYVPLRSTTPSA